MPPWAWLLTLLIGLPALIWLPSHLALARCFGSQADGRRSEAAAVG